MRINNQELSHKISHKSLPLNDIGLVVGKTKNLMLLLDDVKGEGVVMI